MENTINERFKKVRKDNKLTQEEYGKKLMITGTAVSKIEKGVNSPSDQTVKLICSEFNINEEWLRIGKGEMYTSNDDRFVINLGKLSNSQNEFIKNAINYFAEAEPEKIKIIEDFMKALLKNQK